MRNAYHLARRAILFVTIITLAGCSTASFPTVPKVDLAKFMGPWYVAAGRFTSFEKDVNNAVEIYSYDEAKQTIKIDFSYRKGSPDGKEKKMPQKGEVVAGTANAHWLVSPFWPLKFDYLIIALADDYSWTAIGVPNQKYLWIMTRAKNPAQADVDRMIEHIKNIGYNVSDIKRVPQKVELSYTYQGTTLPN